MPDLQTIGPTRSPVTYRTAAIWDPGRFQDGRRRRGYFEGWYFKCVDATGSHPVSIIPGVSLERDGDGSHAFIQLIQTGGRTAYWEFPTDAFRFSRSGFEVHIDRNVFSADGLSLDLDGDAGRVRGELEFGEWTPWPVRVLSPGIMGWYRFVPFMETYHGVLSMDHTLAGSLDIDGSALDFEGGRGYVEKDWGRSFPSAWIWTQCNHFGDGGTADGTSVSISVARIPWLGGSFIGYIIGVWHDGQLHAFTTYNGTRVRAFSLGEGTVLMSLSRGDVELDIEIAGAHPGKLRSPVLGAMSGEVWESLEATVRLELVSRGRVLLDAEGRHAGVELMDDGGTLQEGLGF